jgi:fucose 4-O-acetylase-like acetyltransferase
MTNDATAQAGSMKRDAKPRVDTIDYAKGVGILLVVAGHVWRGLDSRIALPPYLKTDGPVDRWVYGFHMPLFFVVSGLFLFRSAGKPACEYLVDKLSTLLWPLLVWTAIYLAADKFVGAGKSLTLDAYWRSLVSPPSHLWFLWVLLCIAVVMLALRKAALPAWAIFLVSVGVYFAVTRGHAHLAVARYTTPLLERPMFQFAMFFPYVAAAGMLARPLLAACSRLPLVIWIAISAAGASVVTYATRTGPADGQMFNFVSGAAGTLMVLGVSRILEHDRAWPVRAVGTFSLEIYLAHILAAAAVRVLLLKLHVTQWWIHLPAGLIVGVLAPLALAVICRKVRIPLLFRLPGR